MQFGMMIRNPSAIAAAGIALLACLFVSCSGGGPGADALETRQIRRLNELSQGGDKNARFILGYYYFTGEGVLRDMETGRSVIESSVEDRHATARSFAETFKSHLDNRTEIPLDKVVRWVRENAENGDGCAQYIQGTWFAFGRGIPKDVSVARKWLRSAKAKRVAIAGWLLDELAADNRTQR